MTIKYKNKILPYLSKRVYYLNMTYLRMERRGVFLERKGEEEARFSKIAKVRKE